MSRRYLAAVAASVCVLLGSLAAFNWWLDPFHIFRNDGIFISDSAYQRFANAGILLHSSADAPAVVIGSSYVANFRPDLVEALFGQKTKIISAWGSTQTEEAEVLRLALRTGKRHTVFLETSVCNLCKHKVHPFWTFPSSLYRGYPWGTLAYLFSWQTAENGWKKLKVVRSGKFDYPVWNYESSVYRWWDQYKPFFGDEKRLVAALINEGAPTSQVSDQEAEQITKETVDCFENGALRFARENPSIQFIFFNPPVMQWLLWARQIRGYLEPWQRAQTLIAERVASVPNAKHFDFYPAKNVEIDCHRWLDMGHFDQQTSDDLVRWMKEGRFERTPENSEQSIQATRAIAGQKVVCR